MKKLFNITFSLIGLSEHMIEVSKMMMDVDHDLCKKHGAELMRAAKMATKWAEALSKELDRQKIG